jgi:hypothetical protein
MMAISRIRTLTISEVTSVTALYRKELQNVKVEFAYKNCGLSAAGCGRQALSLHKVKERALTGAVLKVSDPDCLFL